jgi:insertion element IS1 protein InsB
MIRCPECNSEHVNKNGRKKNKQNHICIDCGKQFIDSYSHRGYMQEIKEKCLKMHMDGMGYRAIERIHGVHHTTIINWVKKGKESPLETKEIQSTPEVSS